MESYRIHHLYWETWQLRISQRKYRNDRNKIKKVATINYNQLYYRNETQTSLKVMLRRVVKENYSPTLCNSTPRDPEQNSWKQRTPVLEGGWDSYWVEIVAPQVVTCSPNSDKRHLSQGRPPRFDQYLLHFFGYGSNEILSHRRLPWLRKTAASSIWCPAIASNSSQTPEHT